MKTETSIIKSQLLDRIKIMKSREQKVDDRNRSKKSFFNFSYKQYRFYFGIHIPCEYVDKPAFNNDLSFSCSVPSPIVLSNHRHACGVHFSKKYQIIVLKNSTQTPNIRLDMLICYLIDGHQKKRKLFSPNVRVFLINPVIHVCQNIG